MQTDQDTAINTLAIVREEWDNFQVLQKQQELEFCAQLPFDDVWAWADAENAMSAQDRAWLEDAFNRMESKIDADTW
jgi:hypothetical protein